MKNRITSRQNGEQKKKIVQRKRACGVQELVLVLVYNSGGRQSSCSWWIVEYEKNARRIGKKWLREVTLG